MRLETNNRIQQQRTESTSRQQARISMHNEAQSQITCVVPLWVTLFSLVLLSVWAQVTLSSLFYWVWIQAWVLTLALRRKHETVRYFKVRTHTNDKKHNTRAHTRTHTHIHTHTHSHHDVLTYVVVVVQVVVLQPQCLGHPIAWVI